MWLYLPHALKKQSGSVAYELNTSFTCTSLSWKWDWFHGFHTFLDCLVDDQVFLMIDSATRVAYTRFVACF